MATSWNFGRTNGSRTGENEIDLVDVFALMILPITGSLMFEVFSLEINVFGGYNLTDAIWTVGGASISLALIITVGALAWIVVTNLLNDETSHEPYEFAMIIVALGSPIGVVFIPAFESLVMWHDLTQLAFLLYLSFASVWVSFTG